MCKESPLCICLSIVAAFILAAAFAVLFYFDIAPLFFVLPELGFIIVAIALITLTILLVIAIRQPHGDLARCLCCFGKGILILTIALFVILVIALGFPLSPGSILFAVIVFFILLFLLALMFYIAAFIWCLIIELCRRPCHTDNK